MAHSRTPKSAGERPGGRSGSGAVLKPASAQVFLSHAMEKDALEAEAQRLVRQAARSAGANESEVAIRNVFGRAGSFAVDAAPEVIQQIAAAPEVKTVLPEEGHDLLIRPVRSRAERA